MVIRYLIIILLLSANPAFACFCVAPMELTDVILENSDVVFKGTVIEVVDKGFYHQVTFRIRKTIKGNKEETLTVAFDRMSSCAVQQEFRPGENYLIAAVRQKIAGSNQDEIQDTYYSTLCSLQVRLDKI